MRHEFGAFPNVLFCSVNFFRMCGPFLCACAPPIPRKKKKDWIFSSHTHARRWQQPKRNKKQQKGKYFSRSLADSRAAKGTTPDQAYFLLFFFFSFLFQSLLASRVQRARLPTRQRWAHCARRDKKKKERRGKNVSCAAARSTMLNTDLFLLAFF